MMHHLLIFFAKAVHLLCIVESLWAFWRQQNSSRRKLKALNNHGINSNVTEILHSWLSQALEPDLPLLEMLIHLSRLPDTVLYHDRMKTGVFHDWICQGLWRHYVQLVLCAFFMHNFEIIDAIISPLLID
jgi:hypothetical protein